MRGNIHESLKFFSFSEIILGNLFISFEKGLVGFCSSIKK